MKILILLLSGCSILAAGFFWSQNILPEDLDDPGTAFSAPGFPRLQAHFHKYVDGGELAGTAMLVSKNGKLCKDIYGMQNIEAGLPITEHTIFRLASMTKPVTSVAAMMLVEEGKLQLEDAVEKYIPAFRNIKVYQSDTEWQKPRTVLTIKHLLSHSGGITSEFDHTPPGRLCREAFTANPPKNLEELVGVISKLPLSFHPGEGWVYSYSTDVLAYIVERVAQMPIDQFFKERIFDPLQMKHTSFQLADEDLIHFAALYTTGENGKVLLRESPENSSNTNGKNFPRGNGGLTSTISDYYKFTQMLLHKGELDGVQLLQEETVDRMTQNVISPSYLPIRIGGNEMPGYGFGLGFGVLTANPPFGTEGDFFWPGAAFTYFFINPKEEMIGIFMTQLSDMSKMHLIGEFHQLASEVFVEQ